MELQHLKLKHIAYFLLSFLIAIMVVNYFIFKQLGLGASDINLNNKIIESRELAKQMQASSQHLIQTKIYTSELENSIATYDANLVLLKKGGKATYHRQTIEIPQAPAVLANEFKNIEKNWLAYKENLAILMHAYATNSLQLYTMAEVAQAQKGILSSSFVIQNRVLAEEYQNFLYQKQQNYNWMLWGVLAFNIALFFCMYYIINQLILKPILSISKTSYELARGNLSKRIDFESESEIGKVAKNINELAEIVKNATDFSKEIGRGNLEAQYKIDSQDNQEENLAKVLMGMRDKLRKVAQKDKQEKWISEGLAKFSEILRKHNHKGVELLSEKIVNQLVKYLDANQGAIFIANNDDEQRPYLELVAKYATESNLLLHQQVEAGEGLVGQAFKEAKVLHMTDIPKDFLKVHSGLGNAIPKGLLLIPLKSNDYVEGVIEIAALREFENFEIVFAKKLAENIASTISMVKINEKNQKLLDASHTTRFQAENEQEG